MDRRRRSKSRSWRRRSRGCRRANAAYFLIYYVGAWEGVRRALSRCVFVVIRVACVFSSSSCFVAAPVADFVV